MNKNKRKDYKHHNSLTASGLFVLVGFMIALAFASEPLYRIFCQVTGYGGATQIASSSPAENKVLNRLIGIRFDSNVNSKLPWRFKPVQREIKVRLGEQVLAFYEATNLSNEPVVGTASFNVTPYKVAKHFNKIECFCFSEQVLKPGETVQMPVTFFVDPQIEGDEALLDLDTITLSYTFFQADDQSAASELTLLDEEQIQTKNNLNTYLDTSIKILL
ncbi:MAG: cytochrome c oxidase assembly protein [Pseudomonadota bacterium]|nr:cytochrome c oxidase assembly protein [Pseudomonadota bacterium]